MTTKNSVTKAVTDIAVVTIMILSRRLRNKSKSCG